MAAGSPQSLRIRMYCYVLAPVTESMLDRAPQLRLIQKLGVGVNTIDLAAAARRGIPVCNMPGVNTQAVAEATLALILATLRNVVRLDRAAEGRGWEPPPEAGEISGKTVGFVGYGAIAHASSPSFRLWVLARSTIPAALITAASAVFGAADVVSLHLPLTAQTRHLLDRHGSSR